MDRVNLVVCINDILKDLFKRPKFDDESFKCKDINPWSGEMVDLETHKKFMDFLKLYLSKGVEDVILVFNLVHLACVSPLEVVVLQFH